MTIDAYDFAEFFRAVHTYDPFPWQARLAEQVLTQGWPDTIDAPTGLGKTSVIDIALFVLARQAHLPMAQRTALTRTVLVVDRRLIVDSAFEHAERIRQALVQATVGAAKWANDALCSVANTLEPFATRRMRGGLTWSSLWADSPCQPVVLTATVDQFGSRYLFRGYGSSDWSKPVDAGLLGSDTLVLLDEAHLSAALVETVRGCQRVEAQAPVTVQRRATRVVSMTATPGTRPSDLVGEHDRLHGEAGRRLAAEKRTLLIDAPWATSPSLDTGKALAALASERIAQGAATVLVTANTVAAARAAFNALGSKHAKALVIGRTRPIDRDARLATWLDGTRTGRCRDGDDPFVLVATQTVEVGVDIDVDALVTELAPLDSLVQRFGRVDRRGELGTTTSYILRVPSRLRDNAPPYGSASAATWDWLCSHASVGSISAGGDVESGDRSVDMGTLAARSLLAAADRVSTLLAPVSRPPVVLSTAVEAWRRTSPIPVPDEAITGYLHGVGRGEPSVSIAWRCDLDQGLDTLEAFPPASHELVEVPMAVARRFLSGQAPGEISDVEGVADGEPTVAPARHGSTLRGYVRRSDTWIRLAEDELRPGDVVVVGSEAGGHDSWGFDGESEGPTVDVAELDGHARFLRLDPQVLAGLIGRPLMPEELESLAAIRQADLSSQDRMQRAQHFCGTLASADIGCSAYADPAATLFRTLASEDLSVDVPGANDEGNAREGRLVLRRRSRKAIDGGDDGERSSTAVGPVRLADHLASVGDRAADFARRCGVTADLVEAVRLAGRFHDLGKADVRFQSMLSGEPMWMLESGGADSTEMLAKSAEPGRAVRTGSSPWPVGLRHEALSLAMVERAPDEVFAGVDRQLVEHLVGSHHGRARPLFPPIADSFEPDVAADFDGVTFTAPVADAHPAWSQPQRYARLCDRYGAWGLAYLEALVRLADISISKEGR